MSRFTDADGNDWTVTVTTVEIRQIRDELDIDLLDVGNEKLFARLTDDELLIVDVLHICCREQCQQRELDTIGFVRGLRGDVLDAASDAFLESYAAFFRKSRRSVLQAALTRSRQLMDRTADHAIQTINSERMDQLATAQMQKIDREIDEQIRQAQSSSASSSPNGQPSPESPPTPA